MFFNIRKYGAVGDGVTFDAPAIQQALDAANAAGGGTVIVPPGVYLIASLKLRSNVSLYLSRGSRLKSPETMEHYEEDPAVDAVYNCQRFYMIEAHNVENITVEGDGVIDGTGDVFWEDEFCNTTARKAKEKRPTTMYFFDCKNVTLRNIRIENSATYTVWMLGCDDVVIDSVTIRNDRQGPNTDALDIDCCRNVRISNCDIVSGDDCIALKSDLCRLGREAVCENVVVSNCIFSASTCAIRIGYEGDGVIRDCIFQGIVCRDCAKGIAMQSLAPGDVKFTKICKGTPIENMQFVNFVMRDVDRPFFIRAGNDEGVPGYQAKIKNITISNIQGTALKESFIGSTGDYFISGLQMNDINLDFIGELSSQPGAYPNIWGHVNFPSTPFAMRYIDGVSIRNMTISGNKIAVWKFIKNGSVDGIAIPADND